MNTDIVYNKQNVFAVAGASNDKNKYGYRVYKMLKNNGVTVYPVNPNRDTVDDDKAFPDINSLPELPDVLSIVTPPQVSFQIVSQAIKRGVKNIWLQPGAWDEKTVALFKKQPEVNGIYGKCILIENQFE